MNNSKKHCR